MDGIRKLRSNQSCDSKAINTHHSPVFAIKAACTLVWVSLDAPEHFNPVLGYLLLGIILTDYALITKLFPFMYM